MTDEQLFRWLCRHPRQARTEEVAGWLAGDPGRRRELASVLATLRLSARADDALEFGPPRSADEIIGTRRIGRTLLGGKRFWFAAAAMISLGATLLFGLRESASPPAPRVADARSFGADDFSTESEPATIGLKDGTTVRLAPTSRLRLHDRQDVREVSLNGRGYFAVAADPTHPFVIVMPMGSVTVLGTRFELTVHGDEARLIVVEGRVRLESRGRSIEVAAGQMARIIDGNLTAPVTLPDPMAVLSWLGNFMAFHDTPLRTVARELERAHGVPIELADSTLSDRTVTALFAGRSFEEIIEVVCIIAELRCSRRNGVLLMAPRP